MVYGFLLAPLIVSLGGAAAQPQPQPGPRDLGAGVNAFRAGSHKEAIAALRRVRSSKLRNADYAAFFLAEALAATNAPTAAIPLYQEVIRGPASRFTSAAQWRLADALWQLKRRNEAKAQYDRLLAKKVPNGDPAQAWMRIGTFALAHKDREAAIAAFEKVAVSFAKHPAAVQANDQLLRLRPSSSASPADGTALSPAGRISRARALSDRHQWSDAISDLQTLTGGMTPDEAALRDFVLGQAMYRSRSDYAGASKLLYGAVPLLPEKEAIWAAFHGARALSRADRDDEAIEGYLKFVGRYPNSTFASEAQFLAGWLHFNQGRFAESAPALTETMKRFARTPFAVDAAWYLFLGSYFANDFPAALANLAVFDDTTQGGRSHRMWPADRVKYWRARVLARLDRKPEATQLYQALVAEQPLRWYGLLATAQLRQQGVADPINLVEGKSVLAPLDGKALRDPLLQRVDELMAAQLPADAGYEIERGASLLMKRLGRAQGLTAVISRSHAAGVWAQAYRLADIFGSGALAFKPQGDARVVWQAVYPQAFPELVNKYGPAAGNPAHYLNTIMHKESGFDPIVISYANARGLLQMIPPTSRKVASSLGMPYDDEALLQPETNVRLGAVYIGALYKKFLRQIPAAAGAYNAGPGAMMRWLDRHGKHPLDEFVELVPYEQTREYIKRVCGIYARYRYLYADERYVPSLAIDPAYLRDEPNY